ncbi:MAG: YlmC/YmxH family sporulation protein [Clostridia bacterium]
MDITYNELRSKEVINVTDGRRLGRICDIVISSENCVIKGIVVPQERKVFRSKDDLYIPWTQVKRIGDDCILVYVTSKQFECNSTPPKNPKGKHFCDYIIDED